MPYWGLVWIWLLQFAVQLFWHRRRLVLDNACRGYRLPVGYRLCRHWAVLGRRYVVSIRLFVGCSWRLLRGLE